MIDFNNDGDFNDADEEIINQAVSAPQHGPFAVPLLPTGIQLFRQFRIYPERPLFVSSTGMALDAGFQQATGEVEDYMWTVYIPTRVTLADFRAYEQNGVVIVKWETASELDTLGLIF